MRVIKPSAICIFTAVLASAQAYAAEVEKTTMMDAEFAVRWNPSVGGPKSARQVLDLLGLKQDDKDEYEAIRYYDPTKPVQKAPGVNVILRERVKKKKADLTFKLRSAQQLAAASPDWCPLGPKAVAKEEIDVSVFSAGEPKEAHSRSCKLDVDRGASFPDALGAKLKGCQSKMIRLQSGPVTIEEWKLPNGSTVLELSKTGKYTTAELATFRDGMVAVVTKAGAKPLDRSMSEVGSDCK